MSLVKDDPVHRALVVIGPRTDRTLASQPTISRFENGSLPARDLDLMASTLCKVVKTCRRVTVDLDVTDDPTDDPTRGNQQFSMFNGFYESYCHPPVLGFLRFDDEPPISSSSPRFSGRGTALH